MKRTSVAVRVAKPVHPLSHLGQIAAAGLTWLRMLRANLTERVRHGQNVLACKLSELSEAQRHAIITAESHGHTLTRWHRVARAVAQCECSSCGSVAVIRLRGHRRVSLHGDALNSNCAEEYC